MSDERKLPNQAKSAGEGNSSSAEDTDLESFCAKVCYEEISFDSWRAGHSNLDLRYPLVIKRSLLEESAKHLIKLSRTIAKTSASGRRSEQRERFECEVALCRTLKDGLVLKYPGLGDRCDEDVGDLLIILQITD